MLTKADIQSMTDGQRELLALGMKMAEERSIKLLDAYFEKWFAVENPNDYEVGRTDGVAACIALIKGESAKGSVEPAQLEVLIKGEK